MRDLIAQAVEMGATNPPGKSQLHGEGHWKMVAIMGFWLARQSPVPIDLRIVYAFAQLHDICRLNDSNPGDPDDSEHGARAARLFYRMVDDPGVGEFPPYADRTTNLHTAIALHVSGSTGQALARPEIGLCWDADRLTLWRVGITPDRAYLTTEAARSREALAVGQSLVALQFANRLPSWRDIRREMETWRFP